MEQERDDILTSPERDYWLQMADVIAAPPTKSADTRLVVDPNVRHVQTLEALQRAWHASKEIAAHDASIESTAVWNGIAPNIFSHLRSQPRHRRIVAGRLRGGLATAAAAALAVTMVVVRARDNAAPSSQVSTYATTSAQRATITLADGSRVTLAPATTLYVHHRSIVLSGEALFTVTARTNAPFSVITGKTITRVLGTTFAVRRYPTDHATRVAVVDGRIAVHDVRTHTSYTTVFGAGNVGIVDDSGAVHLIPSASAREYTEWTSGRLTFRATPVREIAEALGRAYGVEIRVTNTAIATHQLTLSVATSSNSLDDVVEALARTLNTSVTRSGNVITIGAAARALPIPQSSPVRMHSLPKTESEYGK